MSLIPPAAALLAAVALLASAATVNAQGDGAAGAPLPVAAGALSPGACDGEGTGPDRSADAYRRRACFLAGDHGPTSRDGICSNPNRGYSGLLYTDTSLYHAPGGEAYSYAGY